MPAGSAFQRAVERELSEEPGEVLHFTDSCAAWVTSSGWLYVSWPPTNRPGATTSWSEPENAPCEGSATEAQATAPGSSFSSSAISFSMPRVLVGDAMARPFRGSVGLVVQHACLSGAHTWLGPWDEPTVGRLVVALRERLGLPRNLGAPIHVTEAALALDPDRYHGMLIEVEGRWHSALEAPTFVAGSGLVFPPGFPWPDRAKRVRVSGVWVVDPPRPNIVNLGPDRHLHAASVVEIPWAAGLPETHPRVGGHPLPTALAALLHRGAWAPGIVSGRLLYSTGWARGLDTFFGASEMEAEIRSVRSMTAEAKLLLGFGDEPRCLDVAKTLILAKNVDGRMIALDYRADPPLVMVAEEALGGVLRWRRLDGDFDSFAANFLRSRAG